VHIVRKKKKKIDNDFERFSSDFIQCI